MKKEIELIEDIKYLVNSFYDKVKQDDTIGYIFNDSIKVDWEHHLPKMYNFWETVLLGKASFKGNPMLKHLIINNRVRLTEKHFDRWIELWDNTIDSHFMGDKAENAKQRARTMKQLMLYKIRESEKPNFIQ